jgi:hypothetical protein
MYSMKNKLKIYTMQLDYNTMQCIIPNPGWGGGGGGGGWSGAGSTRALGENNLRPSQPGFFEK